MKVLKNNKSMLRNSRGMISADFIFALVLSIGLCTVLFTLTFTMSMAEVSQYIAFSTARAAASAHKSISDQERMGMSKFEELRNRPVLKELLHNPDGGWFELAGVTDYVRGGARDRKDFTNEYPALKSGAGDKLILPATGVRLLFKPKILNMKIAFLGNTSSDPDTGFSTFINAFIFREPSQDECLDQMKQRYETLIQLSNYKKMGAMADKTPAEDNGC